MIIRELYACEQPVVSAFMLDLPERDRYRRFCRSMSDEAIRAYVAAIDWSETVVLGGFDLDVRLIGLLELCDVGTAAEIAVAVAADRRGHGVARALMTRAMLKAKVQGKQRVVLTCLTKNVPMRRLARSVGLSAITRNQEVERELALEQPRLADIVQEATHQLVGNVSYAGALCSTSYTDLLQQLWHAPPKVLRALARPSSACD